MILLCRYCKGANCEHGDHCRDCGCPKCAYPGYVARNGWCPDCGHMAHPAAYAIWQKLHPHFDARREVLSLFGLPTLPTDTVGPTIWSNPMATIIDSDGNVTDTTAKTANLDGEQTPIYVMDDGVWCPGFLVSEDPMAPEVHVWYTDKNGGEIEDCIPNNRDNLRIKLPNGGGTYTPRPDGHLDSFSLPLTEPEPEDVCGIPQCADPRGKDHLYWTAKKVQEVVDLEPWETDLPDS